MNFVERYEAGEHEQVWSELLAAGADVQGELRSEALDVVERTMTRVRRNIERIVETLGFGIFMASSPRNWESQNSRWPGSSLARPEYMTPPMYGYALAHLAWFDGEEKPRWEKYLGSASKNDFKQSIRFLFTTGDTTFRPRPRALDNIQQLIPRSEA